LLLHSLFFISFVKIPKKNPNPNLFYLPLNHKNQIPLQQPPQQPKI